MPKRGLLRAASLTGPHEQSHLECITSQSLEWTYVCRDIIHMCIPRQWQCRCIQAFKASLSNSFPAASRAAVKDRMTLRCRVLPHHPQPPQRCPPPAHLPHALLCFALSLHLSLGFALPFRLVAVLPNAATFARCRCCCCCCLYEDAMTTTLYMLQLVRAYSMMICELIHSLSVLSRHSSRTGGVRLPHPALLHPFPFAFQHLIGRARPPLMSRHDVVVCQTRMEHTAFPTHSLSHTSGRVGGVCVYVYICIYERVLFPNSTDMCRQREPSRLWCVCGKPIIFKGHRKEHRWTNQFQYW